MYKYQKSTIVEFLEQPSFEVSLDSEPARLPIMGPSLNGRLLV